MTKKNPKEYWSKRKKFEKPDECYTPEYAISPLVPYLKKEWVIWDCAFGSGKLAEHFKKKGFNVVGRGDSDFFNEFFNCDIVITNPPYSLKDKFLEKAFRIGKPFAFLLPLTTLEGIKRSKMFRDKNIQLIIPNKRINFENPIRTKERGNKSSCWFATAWFCYGLNLPNQLNFVELDTN